MVSGSNMETETTILVADDDPMMHAMVGPLLERWGYQYTSVLSGQDAFAHLRRREGPSIAILDWMMPDMEGVEVIARLSKEHPSRFVYSILLTAREDEDALSVGLDSGACDFLRKPFRVQELRSRLAAGLRFVDQQQQIQRYASTMEELARERAAQLLHADRLAAVGVLAAGVAHEINNPAASLSGNLQLMEKFWPDLASVIETSLQQGPDDERLKRLRFALAEMPAMIEAGRSNVKRISAIVASLRLYARKDSGQEELCNLNECLASAVTLCGGPLKQRVVLKVHPADSFLGFLGSSQQIEQVLINLLINAADAMDDQAYEQSCLTVRSYPEDGHVCVSVEDEGPGIPDPVAAQLFTPFYTTKPAGKGTGLGLSVSLSIARACRGNIEFENRKNGGARFILKLPAQAFPGKEEG